jgi:hypothetical protein
MTGGLPSDGEQSEPGRKWDRSRAWTVVAVGFILLISLARVPHLGFPLERDEGEFGYIAQQLLHGVPVYDSAYTQKLPGSYYVYALFLALFGQSILAIHLGLLLVNAAIMGLMFLTLRRTHGSLAGVTGALVFGFMALSPNVLGFAAHATFFVALFSMAGLYVFLLARDRGSSILYLGSGLCLGLAFLMKQSGIFFAPLLFGSMVVDAFLAEPKRPQGFTPHAAAFVAGSLAPLLLTAAYYAATGRFTLFWFWPFQLACEFRGHVGFADGIENFYGHTISITSGFEILWLIALAGFPVMLREAAFGNGRYPYLVFGLASLLSIVPGFSFSSHYYITLLPFVALLIGGLMGTARVGAESPRTGRVPSGPSLAQFAIVGAAIGIGLLVGFARFETFFTGRVSDEAMARRIYRGNPFVESIEIAEYLKSHTSPQDSIAILGSETQIYFYAQRPSASRFVNVYFLMADHRWNRDMQREMIRDIERVRPAYLIFVHIPFSWGMMKTSPQDISEWYEEYKWNYQVEGVVQMQSRGSVTTWGADAGEISPTRSYIKILRRID